MDKYRLVEEKFIGAEGFVDDGTNTGGGAPGASAPGEGGGGTAARRIVLVTQQSKPRSCITAVLDLLAAGPGRVELRAMGKAVNKAVTIAEIVKHRRPLHQTTALSSCEVVHVYAPLEEGLDVVTSRHYVSCIAIALSADGAGVDVRSVGYQPPVVESEMRPGDTRA